MKKKWFSRVGYFDIRQQFVSKAKLTFLILLLSLFTVQAKVYSQFKKVSFKLQEATVKEVLASIEDQSGHYFMYNDRKIDVDRKVSLNADNEDVESILSELFANTEVKYLIKDRQIVLYTDIREVEKSEIQGQQSTKRTVTGEVTDATGNAIPGVSVAVKGTAIGVITDSEGKFTIAGVSDDARLVFSFIGMKTIEREVGKLSSIKVVMQDETLGIDEVVVIGYGTRTKKDLTGAVSQMTAEAISKKPTLSMQNAMQGQMAGVLVSTSSSDPMARPSIRIRGVSTMGYNEPLYVIDGIPVTEGGTGSDIDSRVAFLRGEVNPLNMINPQDIESISILKDASASAIYGLRASNGVVLITTKRGMKGKVKVNVTSSASIQNIYKRYHGTSIADYVSLSQEALDNRLKTDPGFKKDQYYSLFDPTSPQFMGNSADYRNDWLNANLVKNALIQDHNVSVTGGNEASNYAFGAGYSTQEQATVAKDMTRYSVFANSDHKIAKWFKVGETIRLVYTKTVPQSGGDGLAAEFVTPWQPFYDNTNQMGLKGLSTDRLNGTVPNPFDPSYVNSLNGYALPGRYLNNYTKAGNPLEFMPYGYGAASKTNFLGQNGYGRNEIGMYRTLGGFYAELSPLKGLRVKGSVNVDYYTQSNEEFRKPERALFESNNGKLTTYINEGNYYRRRFTENFNMVKEFLVGYNNTFGEHHIDLIFNASEQTYKWNITAQSINLNSPIEDWEDRRIDEGWSLLDKGGFYDRSSRGLLGYMGRMSYHYANKYYLDATIRRDGSSMFAPGYKWGTFPSFAIAWRISDEKFMDGISWLDDLKLRFGWGKVGNQETRPYSYLSLINFNPRTGFGSGSGIVTPRPGDGLVTEAAMIGDFPVKDLTWETVTNSNAGFDAILFDNKLSVTADYYNRFTDGILQNINLNMIVGVLSSPKVNLAQVRNSGIEIQTSYNDKFGKFGFNATANLTTVKNRVEKMAYGKPSGGDYRTQEGYSMNYLYGYKTNGLFQNDQEVAEWKASNTDSGYDTHKSPGDVRYVDLYSDYQEGSPMPDKSPGTDGKISAVDRTYLGKTIPGFFYGVTLGTDYNNFDLSMNLRGVGDVQTVDDRLLRSASGFGTNFDKAYKNRWTVDNPNTSIPRIVQGDPSGNNRLSDRMIRSGAFLRLQDLQLGYTLSNELLKKISISKLRCYLSGSNLFVIHGLDALDPENELLPTTFTIGANISF